MDQHYIDEQTGEVFGYEKRSGLTPCRKPEQNEVWDIVTHDWVADEALELQATINHFTSLINGHIQSEIDAYNKANGISYASIDSFTRYIYDINDPHYPESKSFLDWASACWTYARQEQDKLIAGTRTLPTDAEFIAELPIRA
ncbi:MAG: hypothetical protein R3203_10175 [Pseudoalteromonas tetraodonis]|nr:hypothetical protein [Pseudoalteromonas tetraodonis]